MSNLLPVFFSILIAELGDKTQLATLLFATDPKLSHVGVFVASTLALTVSSFFAVLIGDQVTRVVSHSLLQALAGVGFIVIGLWILLGNHT